MAVVLHSTLGHISHHGKIAEMILCEENDGVWMYFCMEHMTFTAASLVLLKNKTVFNGLAPK